MLIVESNSICVNLNNNKMAKEVSIQDIEEGEISDDESQSQSQSQSVVVEEQEETTTPRNHRGVWMGCSMYGSGLFNYAWAQAVQNKPLHESLLRDFELNNRSTLANSNAEEEVSSNAVVVTGDASGEKEEGEVEEGEITMDDSSDLVDQRFKLIRDLLDSLTVNEVEKSFDQVCGRLKTCLDELGSIVSEDGASRVGDLIDKAFAAITSVFKSKQHQRKKEALSRLLDHVKTQVPNLFSLEQMKEIQAALESLNSATMSSSFMDVDSDIETKLTPTVKKDMGIPSPNYGLMNSSDQGFLKQILTTPEKPNNLALGSQKRGLVVATGSKGRGSFTPLIDLHSDHDVDSLPSPTREAPPPVHFQQRQTVGDAKQVFVSKVEDTLMRPNAAVKPGFVSKVETKSTDTLRPYADVKPLIVSKVETKSADTLMHPYQPDNLTVVSTYQEKFSRSSFHLSSRLPSPTPSEENDGNDSDTNEEVSSLATVTKLHPPMPLQDVATHMDKSSGQQTLPTKAVGQITSGPNIRVALKNRDPRLRLVNPEIHPSLRDTPKTDPVEGIINLRKNKNVGENPDNLVIKRQKNDSTSWDATRNVRFGEFDNYNRAAMTFSDRTQATGDPRKFENKGILSTDMQASSSSSSKIGGTEQVPAVGTNTGSSFPSLLKDIAGNSAMLLQLIMEQQRLAAEAQKSSNLLQSRAPMSTSNLNPTPGTTCTVNVAPSKFYDFGSSKQAGNRQTHSQTTSMNAQGEAPKIRLKPRDPRWVLFEDTFQNHKILGAENFGVQASQTNNDNLRVRQQNEQTQTSSSLSQSSALPDITQQFTKNLRNLADIFSSQSTNSVSTSTVAGNGLSQTIPDKVEKADMRVPTTDSMDMKKGATGTPSSVTEISRPQSNTWGDVEHLFGAYDDHQKATIQKERIRRIEEQNRMFAAKKLCLVLDLDHTLLNSAKFVEVEPAHEEILRKKEEQDREKPWRHLFRLSHMAMWTKLRPGIWTFLQKASKLYELHLYTMGNNSYATEMAKLLDPSGTLFSGRVIAKGDDGDPFDSDDKIPKFKDLDGVLGMESAVVIIDDSVKVWPHNKLNLIAVERYTYFPCSRRQFGLMGPSLLEIDHDERPNEGTLASTLNVIERIHQNFFSNPSLHEVDVRAILAAEQRKILAGCRILFSRIFPVGEAKPHQHPLWQTAEQFGAVCTTQIDNKVTHVVAHSLGTDKVNWALSTGRYVVHPGWVEASALLYRRANERDFAVKINLP